MKHLKTVAQRSSRNKLRSQAVSAWEDLKRAQDHMIGIAAIADERSEYINENLPPIIAGLEMIMVSFEQFNEGL